MKQWPTYPQVDVQPQKAILEGLGILGIVKGLGPRDFEVQMGASVLCGVQRATKECQLYYFCDVSLGAETSGELPTSEQE